MENNNNAEIDIKEYNKIISKIELTTITEEELINNHKKLVGKTCKNDGYEIKDCGVEFIIELLSRDWGRTMPYHYSRGAEKFIKSEHLSNYFKTSIKELLSSQELSDEVKKALNSDKLINDMSEEELKGIYSSISDFYKKSEKKTVNIAGYIMQFLYKLNGKGVCEFIKNNVNNDELARRILYTSGLNDRASFYSGKDILDANYLTAIFEKLLKLDSNYATEFVKMVMQMNTLGTVEFINSFIDFAKNGFKLENYKVDDDNISLDGLYQISASEKIKYEFISKIIYTLREINPNFTHKGRQFRNYDDYYNKKRLRKI